MREFRHLSVKGAPWISIGKALVLRICWTDLDLRSDRDPPQAFANVLRGKRAGHGFDVVCRKTSELTVEWRDVTAEIVRETKAFRASCKFDWPMMDY